MAAQGPGPGHEVTEAEAGPGGAEGWNPGAVRRAFEGAGQGSGERGQGAGRGRQGLVGTRSEVWGVARQRGCWRRRRGRGNRGGAPGHVSFQPGSLWCSRRVPRAPSRETPPRSGLAPCAANSHPPEKLVSRRRTTPAQGHQEAMESVAKSRAGVAPAQLLPWSV